MPSTTARAPHPRTHAPTHPRTHAPTPSCVRRWQASKDERDLEIEIHKLEIRREREERQAAAAVAAAAKGGGGTAATLEGMFPIITQATDDLRAWRRAHGTAGSLGTTRDNEAAEDRARAAAAQAHQEATRQRKKAAAAVAVETAPAPAPALETASPAPTRTPALGPLEKLLAVFSGKKDGP